MADESSGLTFDLTSLAQVYDKRRSSRPVFTAIVIIFGLVLGVIGVLLYLRGPRPAVAITFIVLGFALSGWVAFLYLRVGATPTRLALEHDRLVLDGRPWGKPVEIRWADPKFRVEISDARGLPLLMANGLPRTADFILQVRSGPSLPLSADAFHALIDRAQATGLQIEGETAPQTGSGQISTIVIRSLVGR